MITSLFNTSLVIDFSDTQHTDKHPLLIESEIRNLIEFIQSHPERRSIHVYLRSGIVSATNRKLQSRLQSLGCRVTAKISL
ncbi:hypothetical protein K8942_02765 [Candidatus Peribacteria bacterium]|nr:MAG: hypothetical protein K8942_02765 [Candidatus Peribacteria bacterium]